MKNIIWIILALALGIFIGYFFSNKSYELTQSTLREYTEDLESLNATQFGSETNAVGTTTASPISLDSAKKWILGYQKEQGKWLHFRPLKTINDSLLRGFFIDSGALKDILKNPQCNGIRIYLAKHPNLSDKSKKRIYTLVFVGTADGSKKDSTTKGIKTKLVTDTDLTNKIYEHVDPCPPNCGTITQ